MAKRPSTKAPPLAEQVELFSLWSEGSFPTIPRSVEYHFQEHGGGLTFWQYVRAAAAFDRRGARRQPARGERVDGTVRWVREDGEFLIEKRGKIISYGPSET